MKFKLGWSSIAIAFVLMAACAPFFQAELTVESITPDGTLAGAPTPFQVEVKFSAAMPRAQTEAAFSLRSNGDQLDGLFEWPDSQTLVFSPAATFRDGARYEVFLPKGLESSVGPELRSDVRTFFGTDLDKSRPSVVAWSFNDQETWPDQWQGFNLTFSRPVPLASVESAVTITPPNSGYYTASVDRTTFTYVPTAALNWQTEYLITVQSSLSDDTGNTLGSPVDRRFYVGTDKTLPLLQTLKGVVENVSLLPGVSELANNSNLRPNEDIELDFSKPISAFDLPGLISITPAAGFSIQTSDSNQEFHSTVTLHWTARLKFGQTYRIDFETGIKDAQGNQMAPVTYYIRPENSLAAPPTVLGLAFDSDGPGGSPADPIFGYLDAVAPTSSANYLLTLDWHNSSADVSGVSNWQTLLRLSLLQALSCKSLSSELSLTLSNITIVDTNFPVVECWIQLTFNKSNPSVDTMAEYKLPATWADPTGQSLDTTWLLRLVH